MAGIFSEWIEEASLQLKKWTNSTHSKALQHWATESSCVSDKLNHWIAFLSVPINSFLFPEPLRVWFLLSVTKRTHYSRFSTISFDNIGIPPKKYIYRYPLLYKFLISKKISQSKFRSQIYLNIFLDTSFTIVLFAIHLGNQINSNKAVPPRHPNSLSKLKN